MPVVGMIYAPALGLIFAASEGQAWRTDVGPRHGGTVAPHHNRAGRRIALPSSPAASTAAYETVEWLQPVSMSGSFVSRGSSLKFCLIACGEADIYPRFGRTMEWDTAAGDAILRAAGGVTTTIDGIPFSYGKRGRPGEADFANPAFVAFGDVTLSDVRQVVGFGRVLPPGRPG